MLLLLLWAMNGSALIQCNFFFLLCAPLGYGIWLNKTIDSGERSRHFQFVLLLIAMVAIALAFTTITELENFISYPKLLEYFSIARLAHKYVPFFLVVFVAGCCCHSLTLNEPFNHSLSVVTTATATTTTKPIIVLIYCTIKAVCYTFHVCQRDLYWSCPCAHTHINTA